MKKTIIAAALVLSLAIVACDDGGDATEAPVVEPTTAAEAVDAVESMAVEAAETMAADIEEAVEDAVEDAVDTIEDAVESPAS